MVKLQAFVGKESSQDWLETDYIHGYFGKRVAQAEREYERFVSVKTGCMTRVLWKRCQRQRF